MTQKIAALFPGQGSQSPDMAAAYESHAVVAETIAEAAAAIDLDLPTIISDKNELDKTENAQPALLAVCVGVFRAMRFSPATISVLAGHSLGEYSALVCGGAIQFSDAARLVRRRGELMRDAAAGGMAAVLGDANAVEELCESARKSGGQIWAANYNSPQQTVVAGDAESIAACREWISHSGIKRVVQLPVSIPSHCPLMQAAADEFQSDLQKIKWQEPAMPILHNATLQYASTPQEIAHALAAQLVQPVRWDALIGKLGGREPASVQVLGIGGPWIKEMWRNSDPAHVSLAYECGPGGVLCGLAKRIADAPPHAALANGSDLEFARASLDLPESAAQN